MSQGRKHSIKEYDWISLIFYLLLIAAGLLLLYSFDQVHQETGRSTYFFQKQLIWVLLAAVGFVLIQLIDIKKIREWSSLIYLLGLLLLAGLFIFGKKVSGATAWYRLGSLGFQPAEFMKLATALGLAKLMSERSFNITKKSDLFKSIILIAIPAVLILLQPDLGTVLIFMAFIAVLYREGLSGLYIFPFLWLGTLFIVTILYGHKSVSLVLTVLFLITAAILYKKTKRYRWNYISILSIVFMISMGSILMTSFVFNRVLKPHQQKRIALLLGKISDNKGVGYHLHQSLIAISNGNKNGQGFMQGVQLRGNYIPEQHTDYIFTAWAEQFGFAGSLFFVLLYVLFIIRLFILADRQKQTFSRVFGYSLASLLAAHFFINILMVLGLFPIVGIPLIFISYGGSSLLIFSLFLFLFLKMDAHRIEEL